MTIIVDPDGLAAAGTALAAWQTAAGPAPGTMPAGADSVSNSVAAHLSAHSASLDALLNHGQQVRTAGGAATMHTAASFLAQDQANADLIAGNTSMSGPAAGSAPSESVSGPALPGIPLFSPPSMAPGETHSTLLHTGPGAQPTRDLADYWQSLASTLDNTSADTSQTSAAIDANWSDGNQQAGANTAAHASWLSDIAGYARRVASAAYDAADHFEQALASTPTPLEFADAHSQLNQAVQANNASGGLMSGVVSAAAARLSGLQGQATDAHAAHHTASSTAMNSIGGPQQPTQQIANGGGTNTGGYSGLGGPGPVSPSGPGPVGSGGYSGLGGLLGGAGGGASGAGGLLGGLGGAGGLQSMLPMLAMLPMMGMTPLMALGGLGRQNTPSNFGAASAGLPTGISPDPGLAGGLGDTLPAANLGGGDIEPGGAVASALPMTSPHLPSAGGVAGPFAGATLPAEAVGTAAASTAGGGGAGYPPPMMGGQGAGGTGAERDMRLFPDRRMVSRPVPNSEAVFGELPRERRPRAKRAAATAEGTKTKEGTGER
jgi:PPE family/PE family